jgi:hypothetical protein
MKWSVGGLKELDLIEQGQQDLAKGFGKCSRLDIPSGLVHKCLKASYTSSSLPKAKGFGK